MAAGLYYLQTSPSRRGVPDQSSVCRSFFLFNEGYEDKVGEVMELWSYEVMELLGKG